MDKIVQKTDKDKHYRGFRHRPPSIHKTFQCKNG